MEEVLLLGLKDKEVNNKHNPVSKTTSHGSRNTKKSFVQSKEKT
jgi:hypothetical protein